MLPVLCVKTKPEICLLVEIVQVVKIYLKVLFTVTFIMLMESPIMVLITIEIFYLRCYQGMYFLFQYRYHHPYPPPPSGAAVAARGCCDTPPCGEQRPVMKGREKGKGEG
jgi:hypothetical protein